MACCFVRGTEFELAVYVRVSDLAVDCKLYDGISYAVPSGINESWCILKY
jgi:hypothetical protein